MHKHARWIKKAHGGEAGGGGGGGGELSARRPSVKEAPLSCTHKASPPSHVRHKHDTKLGNDHDTNTTRTPGFTEVLSVLNP